MIIMNPPYGQRIGASGITDFYNMIGNTMKSKYAGKIIWLLTSNVEAMKSIGLKPSVKLPLYNGALECRFLKFEMYSGSKKQ